MLPLSLKMSLKNRYGSKLSVALSFLCATTNVVAVTQQSFILPLTFEHESNPRFSVTDEQPINRVILVPDYSISILKDTNRWQARASLRIEDSSDQTISQDRSDPTLNLGWTHDYETGQFGVTAFLNNQSTRVSDFTNNALISGDNTRKTRTVSFNWLNNLSERTALRVNGAGTDVSFSGLITTGLVDYRNESASTRLSYTVSEQVETFAELYFSHYKPIDENILNSKTKGVNLGLAWSINDRLNISISAGSNETISESNIQSAVDNESWQGMFNLHFATLRTNSNLSLSRSQSPSSTGGLYEVNQAVAGWEYSLSEKDNVALNVNWVQNLTLNKIETTSLLANYTRQISLNWDFRLSATHRKRDDNLTSAISNSVMISIVYNLPEF